MWADLATIGGASCEVVIAARERLEPVAQRNGVTVGRDRQPLNGRNAQVDALTGATWKDLRCWFALNRAGEQIGGRQAARAVARSKQATPEIDTGPSTFNADRLTDSGLKPEIGPACHTPPDRQPRGLAHSAGQGSTAQPGGRRPYPSRSLAGDCFTYAGLERDSSHVPRCDGAFAGACPQSRGFSNGVHGVISHG